MKKTIGLLFAGLASTAFSQSIAFMRTDFQFVSLERTEKVSADIGRMQPDRKYTQTPERASAPRGKKLVAVRFSLPYAPQSNPQSRDAWILGTVRGVAEPETFKCLSTTLWVPVNGTWSAAFVFEIPDNASLLSFHLGRDQMLDLRGMENAAAITRQ